MLYFISYGKVKFPRQYFSDIERAKSVARYYRDSGCVNVSLRKASERSGVQVASRWVAMWGADPIVREQRTREADEIRRLARSDESIALSNPTSLIGKRLSHELAVCSGRIFQ